MSEKIVIDFGDEKPDDEKKNSAGRIVIDFDDEKPEEKEPVNAEITETAEEIILKTMFNCGFRGNKHLNNFVESGIVFPEGIENGFRKKFSINLKDTFFNSILENNRHIILSSGNGRVYFIDRFSGKPVRDILFEGESFEKTGLVYENRIFINSLQKIREISSEDINQKEIYESRNGFYIWSSLNRYNDKIVFTEYSPDRKTALLKTVSVTDTSDRQETDIHVKDFISDKICIAGSSAYFLYDKEIFVYDFDTMTGESFPVDRTNEIRTDENSILFYLNYRLFITTHFNEIYYIDLPSAAYNPKYSGIKADYINSAGGFDDNLFTGTLDGWKFYKTSGLNIYNSDDEYENRIECISRNLIVLSQKNKIIFCNLNRFQEAEAYVISSPEKGETTEIISALISGNEIFILTGNGIFEVYTNDKLNIHI